MTLYQRFLRKPEFGSYEDFLHNFRINVPENFNFAYDVLDVIAEEEPEKRALQWAHMDGRERAFTFAEIARLSKQAANLFVRLGIQKGDKVMLVLRRHYTFWIAIMALCRIGAVAVPATHLLTKKDIVYRANCAGIKMVVVLPCVPLTAMAHSLPFISCPMRSQRSICGMPSRAASARSGLSGAMAAE